MVVQNAEDSKIIAFLSYLVVCLPKAVQDHDQINLRLTFNFTDKGIKSL